MSESRSGLVGSLGEIIRHQRELNELSMRQFAAMVGISNPYLSQIERGLREPSTHVADAIARALRTSTESLYRAAGIADEADEPTAVEEAIRGDRYLTPRQRQALLTTYEAFAAVNGHQTRRRRARRADPAAEQAPAGSSTAHDSTAAHANPPDPAVGDASA